MQDSQIPKKPYLSEKERKQNQYLDEINQAPYFGIFLILIAIVTLFTIVVLLDVV